MAKIVKVSVVGVLPLCSGCELSALIANSEAIASRMTVVQGIVQGALLDYWTVLAPIVDSLPF